MNLFTKTIVKYYPVPDYIVISVDNFNLWFNAPNNCATYAHPGIFLRLDKLSQHHIEEYFEICYGITEKNHNFVYSFEKTICGFMEEIRLDWRKKQK
jgi:hypothetical protein